jgi:hypothetical protein
MVGGNYQTLMNEALKQFSQGLKLTDIVREAIHETLETCLTTRSSGRTKKVRVGYILTPPACQKGTGSCKRAGGLFSPRAISDLELLKQSLNPHPAKRETLNVSALADIS